MLDGKNLEIESDSSEPDAVDLIENEDGERIEEKNAYFENDTLRDHIEESSSLKEEPSFEDQVNGGGSINPSNKLTGSAKANESEKLLVDDNSMDEATTVRGTDESRLAVGTSEKSCGKDSDSTPKLESIKPSSVLGKIKFAPLNVPIYRRRQTLAVVINALLPFASQWFFFLCFLVPILWPILVGAVEWMRRLPLWKWYAEFFPAKLIAESPLDPKRNYIFGYHPTATGVGSIFPGLKIRLLTLESNFRIPIYREFLLSMGFASVSRKSITTILDLGPGNSCLIVIGGAEESLESKPESANLVLAHRLGFVRMAIIKGADLVPVFGFGENQLYDQVDNKNGTWTRSFQTRLKHAFGFTLPLFYGRGIFTYNFGMLPHRLPLNVIVGSPISVQQNPDPSKEMVQAVHAQYLQALTNLYNRNKGAYWIGSDPPELNFI
ncbi:diacylglycerol O-acyltransferase 1 [Massospora cicadina]|nr:diacylglycerol O-acyltransferase 1 [Massospora cicadina]